MLRLFLSVALLAPSIALAGDDGGRPGAFLDYAASVRSLGMGQAFTGIANDPSAIYWNPSGTSLLQQKSLVAQFSTLMEDSSYGFIGYAQPFRERGGLGIGVVNLQSGSITRRDESGANTGSYDATSNALLMSGAYKASGNLSFGSSFKVIREAIDGDSAISFGLDAGTLFRANRYLQVGLMVRNLVAPSVKLDQDTDEYPRSYVAGFGVTPIRPLTLGVDFEQKTGSSLRTKLGVDYLIANLFSIRGGINNDEVTAGLGIGLGQWSFDYAMGYARASSEIRELGSFQRFGVQFNFGAIAPQGGFAPAPKPAASAQAPKAKSAKTSAAPTAAAKTAAPAAATKPAGASPALRSRTDKNQPALDDLQALGVRMDNWDGVPTDEDQALVEKVAKHIRRGRYLRPAEIYAAQGYVSYFTGEYSRSVRSLEDALKADPTDTAVESRLKRVQALNVKPSGKRKETPEIKAVREKYEAGDFAGAIVLSQRILETTPNNQEASVYLTKSLDRLVLPYIRQAKEFLDKDRFVESFVQFQKVLDYAPENAEAKSYSARLVRIIEKKSDMDYLSRSAPKSDSGVTQGINSYLRGLRAYGHGDTVAAKNAWDAAVVYLKAQPLLQDSVRSTIIELSN